MLRIRCDICGEWSLFSNNNITHFKQGRYISHDAQNLVGTKGKDICDACLQKSERIKARRAELEGREILLAMPGIDDWLAQRPMLPENISTESLDTITGKRYPKKTLLISSLIISKLCIENSTRKN
jgi:hypothetical protein